MLIVFSDLGLNQNIQRTNHTQIVSSVYLYLFGNENTKNKKTVWFHVLIICFIKKKYKTDCFNQNMPVKYELIVIPYLYCLCLPLHKKKGNETNRKWKKGYFINLKNTPHPPSRILCFPGRGLAGLGRGLAGLGSAYGSRVRACVFRQSFMASEPRGAEYPVVVKLLNNGSLCKLRIFARDESTLCAIKCHW